MFKLTIYKDGNEITPIVFETFEKAVQAFKDNNRLGLTCRLENY